MRRALLFLLILAAVTAAATAEQHPNIAKGFDAGKLYQFGDLDSINEFNGNLITTIPIGEPLTSGTLSLPFNLVYNSRVWEYETTELLWTKQPEQTTETENRTDVVPSYDSNAGMGWQVSLGSLKLSSSGETNATSFEYNSPDGSTHPFFSTLHNTTQELAYASQYYGYTRDGSYLRLRLDGSPHHPIVEFPNGERREFEVDPLDPENRYFLTKIYDRVGNQISVARTTGGACITCDAWVITARPVTGRAGTAYVFFELTNNPALPEGVYYYQQVISKIVFPTPQHALPNSLEAIYADTGALAYRFTYSHSTPISKEYTNIYTRSDYPFFNAPPTSLATSLLMSLQLPTGESFAMEYFRGPIDPAVYSGSMPIPYSGEPLLDTSSTWACRLKKLTLPTGGTHEYEYTQWASYDPTALSVPVAEERAVQPSFVSNIVGIKRRTITNSLLSGSSRQVWDYTQDSFNDQWANPKGGSKTVQTVTTIKAPRHDGLQEYDVAYFKVCDGRVSGCDRNQFGFPFTEYPAYEGQAIASDGFSLSRKTYTSDTNAHCGIVSETGCTIANEQWVRYDYDPLTGENQRVSGTKTIKDHSMSITEYSGFDGLGHYRTTTTRGGTSDPIRISTTRYNQRDARTSTTLGLETGDFPSSFVMPLPGVQWIINTSSGTVVHQTGAGSNATPDTHRELTLFDPNNGLLLARRSVRHAQYNALGDEQTRADLSATDLITAYGYDQNGEVTSESYFGGDFNAVGTGELQSSYGANPEFVVSHEYQCGSLTKTTEKTGIVTLDRTVDCGDGTGDTGRTIVDRDTGGATTTFSYLRDGRINSIQQPAGGLRTFVYNPASATAEASVDVNATANGVLGKLKFKFDGLGRTVYEGELLPPDPLFPTTERWKSKTTTFNEHGWVASSRQPDATYPASTVTYDALGRMRTTTAPDGSTVRDEYADARHKTTYTRVNPPTTALPAGKEVQRSFEYDLFGRLTSVEEYNDNIHPDAMSETADPSDLDKTLIGGKTTTSYQYDVSDDLVQVHMGSQNRVFEYDSSGLLLSESHPELNAVEESYTYNSRGQLKTKKYAGVTKLLYNYDDAGRLTRIDDGAGTPVKAFTYGDAASGYGNGKVKTAARYNQSGHIVTETYTYDAAGPIRRETTVTGGGTEAKSFDQMFDYDPLGQIEAVAYPCVSPCLPNDSSNRTATNTYTNAYLTQVNTADAFLHLEYAQTGAPQTVIHGGGGQVQNTDIYTPDPSGMPRPHAITFANLYDACAPPVITTQPAGSAVPVGGTANVSVTATGTQPLSYAWYRKRNTESDFTLMSGAAGPSIQDAVSVPTTYYVVITNLCVINGRVQSQYASVTTQCEPVQIVSNLPIVSDDPDKMPRVDLGTALPFSVYATGTAPLNYTWHRSLNGGAALLVGGNTASIIDTPQTDGIYEYYVKVSNACSGPIESIHTKVNVVRNDCHVKIIGASTCLRVSDAETPMLEVRNQDGGVPPGSYTYQWYVCYNAPATGQCPPAQYQPIAGATSRTRIPAKPPLLPQLLGERDNYKAHVTCGGPFSDPEVKVRWDDLWITDQPVAHDPPTLEASYSEPLSLMVNGYGETLPVWSWYAGESGTKLAAGGSVTTDHSLSTLHLPGTLSSPYWAEAFNSASTWGCNLPSNSHTGWVQIHPLLKTLSLQDTHVLVGGSLTNNTVELERGTGFTTPVNVLLTATPNSVTITPATMTLTGTGPASFTITPLAVTQGTTVTISATVQGFDASVKTASLLVHPAGVQSLAITPSTVSPSPGTQATATGTITLEASPTAITDVALTVISGGGPFTIPPSVRFTPGSIQAGQTTDRVRTFTIRANPVSSSVILTLKAAANGREAQATLTDNPQVQVQISPTTMLVASRVTGTVTLGAPVSGSPARVNLSSNNSLLKVPSFVDINVGQTSTTFFADADFSATAYTGVVTASYAGATSSVTLTVSGGRMSAVDLGTDTAVGGEILHSYLRTTAPVLYPYQALMATQDLTGLSQAISCQTQVSFPNASSETPFDVETLTVTEPHLAYLSAQSRQDYSTASTTIQILPRATYPVNDLAVTVTSTTNKLTWTNPGIGNGWKSAIFYSPGACPGTAPEVGTYGSLIATTNNPYGTLRDSYTHTGRTAGATSCYVIYAYDGGSEYSNGKMLTAKNPNVAAIKWQFASGVTTMTPVSSNAGQLYVTTSRRTMFALAAGAAGGAPVSTWTPYRNASGVALPVTYATGGASSVVFMTSTYYSPVPGCLNASTGALIWGAAAMADRYTADLVGAFVSRGAPYNLLIAATNNITKENLVYGINPANGSVVWTFGTGLNIGPISNSPILDTATNRVYFTARKRTGASANTLWCIQLSVSGSTWTATSVGSFDIGDADASPALWNGRLYAANNTGTIYCFNVATGAEVWHFDTGNGNVKGGLVLNPLASLNLLFSTTNYVWRIADMGTSAQVNQVKLSEIPNPSRPVLGANDNAYIGGGDGKLYQLSGLSTTPTLQNLALTTGAIGTPRYDTGLVYVGSESGVVSAVTSPF